MGPGRDELPGGRQALLNPRHVPSAGGFIRLNASACFFTLAR